MDGGSEEEQNMFQSAHQLSLTSKMKSLRNIAIPPRQILARRLAALSSAPSMQTTYNHLINNQQHQHQHQQLHPHHYHYHHPHQHQHHQHHDQNNNSKSYSNNIIINNNYNNKNNDSYYPRVITGDALYQQFLPNADDADDDSDLYASDEFRMYDFKVRKCTRSRSHDWTQCPFAHPGEKARRRCPRRFIYCGDLCPDFRRGYCFRGDYCQFAHGVFEHWLHPSRYRTEACKDGTTCQRKICFFAHTPTQLRHVNTGCICGIRHPVFPSPTSILDTRNMSPPFSPAQSGGGFSPISRVSSRLSPTESGGNGMTQFGYNMQAMNMNARRDQAPNVSPVFAPCNINQQRVIFSPSTSSASASGSGLVRPQDGNSAANNDDVFGNDGAMVHPDFGWVNDLLT